MCSCNCKLALKVYFVYIQCQSLVTFTHITFFVFCCGPNFTYFKLNGFAMVDHICIIVESFLQCACQFDKCNHMHAISFL